MPSRSPAISTSFRRDDLIVAVGAYTFFLCGLPPWLGRSVVLSFHSWPPTQTPSLLGMESMWGLTTASLTVQCAPLLHLPLKTSDLVSALRRPRLQRLNRLAGCPTH